MSKVSVVIPSFYEKDAEYLELCVNSLRSTTDWDIIVVTNGTKHKPNLSHIKALHVHTPAQGQCQAVNIGAQLVAPNTDYIMVSNSDMYYAPGWNKNLRFDYLVFSPNLIEPTDNGGSAPPFLKLDGGLTLDEFKQDVVDSFVANVDESPTETTGFNLPFFIRKDIWQTIGGYDEKFDPWGSGSDTDLQMKIELAGIKPMRLRDVLVYHFGSKSGTFEAEQQSYWWRNWHYLEDKWGFNRDELNSDTWMCERMLDYDRLKFKPDWKDKYAKN